jgi:hypothetical protein
MEGRTKKRIGSALPRAAIAFQPEYLDFQRGIHVGNLDDNQRITRILKLLLEDCYQEPFVTERFGRGVFWQWIGYLPRANRTAKPVSSNVSFGCSKFFLTVDQERRLFKSGMQIERGLKKARREDDRFVLKPDWDWYRLLKTLTPGGEMERQLKRLIVREGFMLSVGEWDAEGFTKDNFPGMARIRRLLENASADSWAGFQVYYPMSEEEVRSSTGVDLVESIMAIYKEVTPVMNLCMQIRLRES